MFKTSNSLFSLCNHISAMFHPQFLMDMISAMDSLIQYTMDLINTTVVSHGLTTIVCYKLTASVFHGSNYTAFYGHTAAVSHIFTNVVCHILITTISNGLIGEVSYVHSFHSVP